MRFIQPAFSHINLLSKPASPINNKWAKPVRLDDVLKSKPKRVDTYDDLVKDVAQILHHNRNLTLYYRGQSKDYTEPVDGKTVIVPSIFRKEPGKSKLMLKEQFEVLNKKTIELKEAFYKQKIKLDGISMLNKYPEIAWSLLQHYEVCGTPLLDITHSLHVACSFAFDKNTGDTGIVYVLGMPWLTDNIGYNTYEELVNIRLLSVCPPLAQRPFLQEGYLAGPFPNYKLDDTDRVPQFDFGRRLIAKFEIPIKDKKFWGAGFDQIPSAKLYQPIDPVAVICDKLKI